MITANETSTFMQASSSYPDVLASVDDYNFPEGWTAPAQAAARARECCATLEAGKVLFFDRIPFDFPREDREFLLSQRQSESKLHKNVSYRPRQDVLRGAAGDREDVDRLHQIMRRYSAEATRFAGELLAPYAAKWSLDYSSFRPEEEKGRDLPLHKRNDLLHVDAFPTRPMHGRRILRCFTNINPKAARVWKTGADFATLAQTHAARAGLAGFATRGTSLGNPLLSGVKKIFGLGAAPHSAYDKFMLRFHDYLKEQADFQANSSQTRIEFPPCSTWLCFTDSVPHAVLSGQYALEQTFIVPINALVVPEKAPIRILEKIAGTRLAPLPMIDAPTRGHRSAFARGCWLALAMTLFAFGNVEAQRQIHGVTADVTLAQKIYMVGEDMPAQVRVINRSGQTLTLGDSDDWVKFSVRGANNYSAPQEGDMPVANPFTLTTGMMSTRTFNPAPYFDVRKPGRYTLNVTVQLPQWHEAIDCKPVAFTVVQGAPLVDIPPMEFGVASASGVTNSVPETRRYNLAEVVYDTDQLKLYFRLSDGSGRTLRCYAAGPLLSFSSPQAQMDRFNNLHVLWQTGARDFTYEVFMPDGNMLLRETHVYTESRPHLSTNENGNLVVIGGVRRFSAQDIPTPMAASARP